MAESYVFNRRDRYFVRSVEEPTRIDPPEWGYGDVREIAITFVDPTSRGRVQVVTELTGVQIGIGTPGGTVLTTATSSAISAAYAHSFTVPLNVAAINAFLGTEKRKPTTIEFLVTTAGGPARYQGALVLLQQLLSGAVADAPAGDTALGVNVARGVFVPKTGIAGEARIITSASGFQVLEYYGDDKQMHWDPIN